MKKWYVGGAIIFWISAIVYAFLHDVDGVRYSTIVCLLCMLLAKGEN